jgi:mannonate dehydratase
MVAAQQAQSPTFSAHFRNIEGGFLNFRETFVDNGSVDML